MRTYYFYLDETKVINNQEHYTVIRSRATSAYLADEKAKQWAASQGRKLAGGYFTADGKTAFGPNYTIIDLPKGFRAGPHKVNRVDKIMAWEQGDMTDEDTAVFFQELIDDGSAWTLQGCYGRQAARLIEAGLCHKKS
jgi:hypothetical protein